MLDVMGIGAKLTLKEMFFIKYGVQMGYTVPKLSITVYV